MQDAEVFLVEALGHCRELGLRVGIMCCVVGLARVASSQGHFERAARPFAAASESLDDARATAEQGSRLSDAQLNAAWAAGRALSLDEAIAEALAVE